MDSNMTTKFFKSKKFRYGAFSAVFIAVFIALVIAFNLLVSFLDTKYDLRVDLTDNLMYSIGEETDDALKIALGDKYANFDITVTFCAERDMFLYYDTTRTDVSTYYSAVRDVAEEYARIYDGTNGKGKVTVRYVNVNADPATANKIKQQTQLTTLNWRNIIVQNNSDLSYYRVLGFDAFYNTSDTTGKLYAFRAENAYTAAMIQCVVAENITVAFTTGHGEQSSDRLKQIFTDSTLNVITLDLRTEVIPPEVKIIVISDPQFDFTYGSGGEIDKLSDYMSDRKTYNSLIVLVDAETPDLPNIRDYLWNQWGLDYEPNHKITDKENSRAGSNYEAVIGNYCPGDVNTAAYVLHKNASSANVPAVLNNAVALKTDETSLRTIYVETSVFAYPTAEVSYKNSDGAQITESAKSCPLVAISTAHEYANDDFNYNANKYQYVLLIGSTDFAANEYLNNAYGNETMMYSAARAMATDRVALDIRIKTFGDSALTLTTGTAKRLMILITCAIPLLIVIIGIAVFLRRRHQ